VSLDIAFLRMSQYDVELVASRDGGRAVPDTGVQAPQNMTRPHRSREVCSVATASTALMYAHEHVGHLIRFGGR
jgi:hypothetical protein